MLNHLPLLPHYPVAVLSGACTRLKTRYPRVLMPGLGVMVKKNEVFCLGKSPVSLCACAGDRCELCNEREINIVASPMLRDALLHGYRLLGTMSHV